MGFLVHLRRNWWSVSEEWAVWFDSLHERWEKEETKGFLLWNWMKKPREKRDGETGGGIHSNHNFKFLWATLLLGRGKPHLKWQVPMEHLLSRAAKDWIILVSFSVAERESLVFVPTFTQSSLCLHVYRWNGAAFKENHRVGKGPSGSSTPTPCL